MGVFEDARAEIEHIAQVATRNSPSDHALACRLPAAAALKRILDRQSPASPIAAAPNNAAEYQSRFKRLAYGAALCAFAASVMSAWLLYSGLSPQVSWLGWLISFFQIGLTVLGFYLSFKVMWSKPHLRWYEARAAAERARLDRFHAVAVANEPADTAKGELNAHALQLEYVVKFLLENQRDWYRSRARSFRLKYWFLVALRGIAGAAVACAAVPAIVRLISPERATALVEWLKVPERLKGILLDVHLFELVSLIGNATLGVIVLMGALSFVERNARRYHEMADFLDAMGANEGPLKEAREAVAAGTPEGLRLARKHWYIVRNELEAEHREWYSVGLTISSMKLDQIAKAKLPGEGI